LAQNEFPFSGLLTAADSASSPPAVSYQPLRFDKTIRIAVSGDEGDVRITRAERLIIDTPEFQRLRGIKQLGTACWVYPTAIHTRFDHSLGVLQMVDDMVQAIREVRFQVSLPEQFRRVEAVDITDKQRVLARLYGLLHDITHVPFGHTLEDELHIFSSHDAFQKPDRDDEGLDRFEILLGPDSRIGKIISEELGSDIYERFRKVFLRGGQDQLPSIEGEETVFDEIVYFLISDTVCADLLDYLKRDSYFAYLNLNLSFRFLKYMYVADVNTGNGPRRRLVIRLWKPKTGQARRDIMTDLGGLLEARYMIAERIYFHPAKLIVGTMIGRAVLEAKIAGELSSKKLLELSDDSLLSLLSSLEKGKRKVAAAGDLALASKMARLIASRQLHKIHKRYSDHDFSRGGANVNLKRNALEVLRGAETRRQIENEITDWVGVLPGDVLIYPAAEKMNSKVADVQVDWNGAIVKLADISDPILSPRLETTRKAHAQLWSIDLMVAPHLSAEQRKRAEYAFEAKFLGPDRAAECYDNMVRDWIEGDPKYSNYSYENKRKASGRVAEKLIHASVSFHGKSLREAVMAIISEEIE
jgi:HD superfamily phosphohydrolase